MTRCMRVLLPALLAGLLLASCDGVDTNNQSGLPEGVATRAQVLRGRYLVMTSGCASCHNRGVPNPYDSRWLAGYAPGAPGQPLVIGAMGASFRTYPSNLTPDVETGLGGWTAQELFNALREGKDRDGRYLAPSMPWLAARNMMAVDLWAIVAYLRSVKPVANAVPVSEGPNPFPDGQGNWSELYPNLPPAGLPPFPTPNETDVE